MEPTAEYASGFSVGDEHNSYDNYDMYYDQAGGTYTDPGGSFSNTGHFADDASQVMEHRKPIAHKVLMVELRVKLCINRQYNFSCSFFVTHSLHNFW